MVLTPDPSILVILVIIMHNWVNFNEVHVAQHAQGLAQGVAVVVVLGVGEGADLGHERVEPASGLAWAILGLGQVDAPAHDERGD